MDQQPFQMNQQFQQGFYDPNNDMNMFNSEQYYLQMQEIQFMQMYPPPPKGPFPGITSEEYKKFNITEQQQFLKFLKDVAYYYLKSLPKYQKEMEEFLTKNPIYHMTEEEHYCMDPYLVSIKQQKEYENMLKPIEAQQKEAEKGLELNEKPSQQTTQANTPQQSTIPTPQQTDTSQQQQTSGSSDQPKPKKKLNLKSKALTSEIPKPPVAPKYPKHPECIVIENFQQNYYMYVNHFQPQTEEEYIKYPTPASTQKRMADDAAKKKKKEEEINRAIEKRNAAEAPKVSVKQQQMDEFYKNQPTINQQIQ